MSRGAHLTIPELFDSAVERAAAKEWLFFEDVAFTYEAAHRRIAALAAGLRERGVKRGTRVLATARNFPEYVFAWLALMRLGAILLPINPASTEAEVAGFLAQVRPRLVITDEDDLETVRKSAKATSSDALVALVGQLEGDGDDVPTMDARPDDVAVLIPTSGTTGRSKLVMQTQRAYAMAGEGFPFWLGLDGTDRLMTSLPIFHINAPAYSVLGSAAATASVILLPRFSASGFWDSAREHGATQFNAIGAAIEILMRRPERDDDADNPIRLCYTVPAPAPERHLEIERRFGMTVVSGYGLSETPYGLVWERGTRPYGTLGRVRQHPTLGTINECRVLEDGAPVAAGGVGELELKNPAVMLGYFEMPDETEEVLRDGWLRTGDLVRVNADGTFTFVGRRKEVIRRRGESLSPLEVEAALEEHPDVVEAAVVGVASELSEDDVKAFVVLVEGSMLRMKELRDFVSGRLARFKLPRYFEVVPELPHTPTGRVAKHQLSRERNARELDLEEGPFGMPPGRA